MVSYYFRVAVVFFIYFLFCLQAFFGPPFSLHFGGPFEERYRCYLISTFKQSEQTRYGGKIIMPPSALERLARLNIEYPMLFKLKNAKFPKETHCGVLEFIAEEGRVYVPNWVC